MGYSEKQRAVKMLEQSVGILENGWCQGDSHKRKGSKDFYCATGALDQASRNFKSKSSYSSRTIARETLDQMAQEHTHGEASDIVQFNDDFAKDKRYVIRVFKKAIAKLQMA